MNHVKIKQLKPLTQVSLAQDEEHAWSKICIKQNEKDVYLDQDMMESFIHWYKKLTGVKTL